MGSEYKRDREKGTLEISQTQSIQSVLSRFGVSKSSSIPATPSLDLRHASEEETRDRWEPDVDREPDEARYRECISGSRLVFS